ncbi:hypothetical protein RhiTH_010837 [Rhizoctonia solani]
MHAFDVFLDIVHHNSWASRGCSFAINFPITPASSPDMYGKDIKDISQCPFAPKIFTVDPAYNPHVQSSRTQAGIGLDTPPLTPMESEVPTVIPVDPKIPAHGEEPIDTSFLAYAQIHA